MSRGNGGVIGPPLTPTASAASGIWSLADASVLRQDGDWPSQPGAPTSVSASAADSQATVSFTNPASNGGYAITSYTVTSSPGNVTATGSSSPITVTGLTNGTAYTFTVTATNVVGTSAASSASNSVTPSLPGATISYLIAAGGGGGSGYYATNNSGGGGGGGGGLLEGSQPITLTSAYPITIGAGGTCPEYSGTNGSDSIFNAITAYGGGGGAFLTTGGKNGGSGSGAGGWYAGTTPKLGGKGVYPGSTYIDAPRQGYDGGTQQTLSEFGGGGGGGAGGAGQDSPPNNGGNGGAGAQSSITGTALYYCGGGGGGARNSSYTNGVGGSSIGGNGGQPGTDGVTNRGGGGGGYIGGGGTIVPVGANGGSGVIVLKYPDSITISNPGGGLTMSTPGPSGGFKVTTITAGTGNISWS